VFNVDAKVKWAEGVCEMCGRIGRGWRGLELSQVEFRASRMAICSASRGTYA